MSDYEKKRDEAAESHARHIGVGLVDPTKFYAFQAGADWAIERYVSGVKQAMDLGMKDIYDKSDKLADAKDSADVGFV